MTVLDLIEELKTHNPTDTVFIDIGNNYQDNIIIEDAPEVGVVIGVAQ